MAQRLITACMRVQDHLSLITYWLGSAALGLIVVIFSYEVFMRYFFSAPTYWANDFVSFLLLISVFAVLPWLTREGGNVSVTLLADVLPARPAELLTRFGLFVGAVVCVWVAYLSIQENILLFNRNTMTLTTVRIPKWMLTALITYGLLNSGLYFLRMALLEPVHAGERKI